VERIDLRVTSAVFESKGTKDPTLQEILVALSFALDLTEGAVPGHAIRCCLLAVRIATAMGMDHATISDLYYASLLKDVGCSSNSARMCQIVGGDDRMVKAGAKLADWTRPMRPQLSTMKMLWKQVLPGGSIFGKTARIAKIAADQHKNNEELIALRCDRGAQIVKKLGLGDEIAVAVRHLDEHWDGGGYPLGLTGRTIPVISRLMAVAQHLDAFCMDRGPESAIEALIERKRRWFDPDLTAVAVSLHKSGDLWMQCLPGQPVESTYAAVLRLHRSRHKQLSALDIDSICEAFADVVDAKSPFTYRHSMGVRDAAVSIGIVLGLPEDRMRVLRRAALLHDLGKLSVPNTILDKPGKLTDEEFTIVKGHPALSAEILNRVEAFGEIAIIAGEHHEKLDGTGYPFRLCGEELSLESRVLAVADIFGALSEERPSREALGQEKITSIMERDVPLKLDAECYEALQVVMAHSVWPIEKQIRNGADSCSLPAMEIAVTTLNI
jgi:putative nucleotidyltransferase with HDIG domain